jgi:NAD(P)-dependent dehydrogenase (short-subunit alcohol dehydrogenase family)
MFSLDAKVVVVTGAAAGIGAATAERLSSAGAVVIGIDTAPFDAATQAHCAAVYDGDVAREERIREIVAEAVARFGRLDGLVNNAGVSPSDRTIIDDSDAAYLRAYRVNVLGAAHLMRAVAPSMPVGSAIVNIASLSALLGAPSLGAYASSKAALVGLTRTAALELAPAGVRVNAIAPSGVDTAMLSGESVVVNDERAWIAQAVPMPRLIRPDEVAALVHYLLADESAMVTGQCLVIDGGASVGPALSLFDLVRAAEASDTQ